jgi:hypothetical protein
MKIISMVKLYGVVGLGTIVLAEIFLYFKVWPFTAFFCPLVWLGYILLIDSVVLRARKSSLLTRHPKKLIAMFTLSLAFWMLFEFYNKAIPGWTYVNVGSVEILAGLVAFAAILPAIMETYDLLRILHAFDAFKTKKLKTGGNLKNSLRALIAIGAAFLVLPFFVVSPWMWAFVWTGFFFLLDPINYLNGQRSIISYVKNGKWALPLSLLFAGFICGFLWEFWNYWAVAKWKYIVQIPLFELKIFEMPVMGFLGFGPFAWELYDMYYFVKFLLARGEKVRF